MVRKFSFSSSLLVKAELLKSQKRYSLKPKASLYAAANKTSFRVPLSHLLLPLKKEEPQMLIMQCIWWSKYGCYQIPQ